MLYKVLTDEIVECTDLVENVETGRFDPVVDSIGKIAKTASYNIYRPVPEPRPVEELTEEEIMEIREVYRKNYNLPYFKDLWRDVVRKADELRSRPRETEKEKWIHQRMTEFESSMLPKNVYKLVYATWDAAYEAGRKDKAPI